MKKIFSVCIKILFLLLFINVVNLPAQDTVSQKLALSDSISIKPVNPEESAEAGKLLKFLYSIYGKKTLTGIHNYLGKMSESTDQAFKITGMYPVIWGGDFGFADSTHDIDNIKYRPLLITEIKKQYTHGAIIVMTYHQANPVMGEPCPFEGGVQSKLTDKQWNDLITPGTPLYLGWQKQMDLFASYLVQLRDDNIPILFRPYHEMNGDWFWWGKRPGDSGYVALWKQLFNYFTKVKKLNNLIWVWTTDRPWEGIEKYYPGDDYVDILGSDIYPLKDTTVIFRQEWYDRMKKLANGKPLALSENSIIPTEEILHSQPWLWFMSWTSWGFDKYASDIKKIYESSSVITLENLPDWKNSCNFDSVKIKESSMSK
ncbi:MAG: glycosyl hydrolase [Ignavibacteriaceae bacterium]